MLRRGRGAGRDDPHGSRDSASACGARRHLIDGGVELRRGQSEGMHQRCREWETAMAEWGGRERVGEGDVR